MFIFKDEKLLDQVVIYKKVFNETKYFLMMINFMSVDLLTENKTVISPLKNIHIIDVKNIFFSSVMYKIIRVDK